MTDNQTMTQTERVFSYLGVYLLGALLAGGAAFNISIGKSTGTEAVLLVAAFGFVCALFGFFLIGAVGIDAE